MERWKQKCKKLYSGQYNNYPDDLLVMEWNFQGGLMVNDNNISVVLIILSSYYSMTVKVKGKTKPEGFIFCYNERRMNEELNIEHGTRNIESRSAPNP